MTPRTLNERKRKLYNEKRNAQKLSEKRKQAARKRWNMQLVYGVNADVYDNDNGDALDDDGDNDNDAEEMITDRINEDNVQNETSTQQYRRVISELLTLLPSHVLDNTHIFKKFYITVGSDDQFRSQLQTMDLHREKSSEIQGTKSVECAGTAIQLSEKSV